MSSVAATAKIPENHTVDVVKNRGALLIAVPADLRETAWAVLTHCGQ
jgi:hypothetical protein